MSNPYINYFGNMKHVVSAPTPELSSYITHYVFYENNHITNNVCLKPYSSGSIELFIHYNESYIYFSNKKKKIVLDNFFVGLHKPSNSFYIKPISKKKLFKGVAISFSFEGIFQLLKSDIIFFTNKLVHIESILGKKSRLLVQRISECENNTDRKNILNYFFMTFLNSKKKRSMFQATSSTSTI